MFFVLLHFFLTHLCFFPQRSFETQLSRVEAELLRREAPPSYGQLIAQGLIPPVEDFPVCSPNQVYWDFIITVIFLSGPLKMKMMLR